MNDKNLPALDTEPKVDVNIKANQFQAMLQADGIMGVDKMNTLSLRTADGKMSLMVPPDMFPFVTKGDTLFVTLTVLKATGSIVQTPKLPGLGG